MTTSKKEKSKRYYKSMIADHKAMLAKMRFIINYALDEMIAEIKNNDKLSPITNNQNHPEIDPESPHFEGASHTQPIENKQNLGENKNFYNSPEFAAQMPGVHCAQNIGQEFNGMMDPRLHGEVKKLENSNYSLPSTNYNPTNEFAKLARIAVKLIPLERELAQLDLTKIELDELHNVAEKLEEAAVQEDMEMIENYVQRYIRQNPEFAQSVLEGLEHVVEGSM